MKHLQLAGRVAYLFSDPRGLRLALLERNIIDADGLVRRPPAELAHALILGCAVADRLHTRVEAFMAGIIPKFDTSRSLAVRWTAGGSFS